MINRPPYRNAAVVALIVLAGYLVSLAPTVTFWDAGEFITAARTLGIPHPPGTPLFVLLTNVWGRLIPFGEFAWRINLFSAVCSAAAAGCWFLVAHDAIARLHSDVDGHSRAAFATLGGGAAALLVSFSFSTWQSATETEVYASAMLAIALVAWIATRWRARRGESGGSRLLLAALYLGALSAGNHLMGLLVGPALIAMLVFESRRSPLIEPGAARSEWIRIGTVAAAWLLIVGIGLGDAIVSVLGGVAMLVAVAQCWRTRQTGFGVAAVAMVMAGVSTLAFLLLRGQQHPWLNSGTPDHWASVLDVIRRAQYPPRTPFDDPTVMHGPGNPGRSAAILAYQVANYAQYFDWQWASSLGDLARSSYLRLAFTLLMATLGIRGAFAQRRADPASFALVAALFFTAGPLLLLYLNFKPGPSIGWDRWMHLADHEVRDRDYFFVASFAAWSVWVAIALVDIVRERMPRASGWRRRLVAAVFAVALIPFALNFHAATRRQSGEATLARDFAHALLGSVPEDAILFTYGDNDTFPLWYAQQVEGFRPDVTVVCLSLAQASWYIARFQSLYDLPLAQVARPPFRTTEDLRFDLGNHGTALIASGAAVYPADIMVIEILRKNAGRRPIAWSITAADDLFGLGPNLVQQGMALVMPVTPVDPAHLDGGEAAAPGGSPLDVVASRMMIDGWNFGRVERDGPAGFDANIRAVTATIAAPMAQTGAALAARGDTVAAIRFFERAIRVGDDSAATAMLGRLTRRTR